MKEQSSHLYVYRRRMRQVAFIRSFFSVLLMLFASACATQKYKNYDLSLANDDGGPWGEEDVACEAADPRRASSSKYLPEKYIYYSGKPRNKEWKLFFENQKAYEEDILGDVTRAVASASPKTYSLLETRVDQLRNVSSGLCYAGDIEKLGRINKLWRKIYALLPEENSVASISYLAIGDSSLCLQILLADKYGSDHAELTRSAPDYVKLDDGYLSKIMRGTYRYYHTVELVFYHKLIYGPTDIDISLKAVSANIAKREEVVKDQLNFIDRTLVNSGTPRELRKKASYSNLGNGTNWSTDIKPYMVSVHQDGGDNRFFNRRQRFIAISFSDLSILYKIWILSKENWRAYVEAGTLGAYPTLESPLGNTEVGRRDVLNLDLAEFLDPECFSASRQAANFYQHLVYLYWNGVPEGAQEQYRQHSDLKKFIEQNLATQNAPLSIAYKLTVPK